MLKFHKLDKASQIQLLKMASDKLERGRENADLGIEELYELNNLRVAEIKKLHILNGQRMRDEDKLLERIVKLEKALKLKADKPTKKVVKAEAKKQKKGLLALVKKLLNKRKK